ncbi:MAG: BPL-N domain-containing protein [Chlamydiia bacterium]
MWSLLEDSGVAVRFLAPLEQQLTGRSRRVSWAQLEQQLSSTRVLVIPGGRDLPYLEAILQGDRVPRLQEWVQQGGVVLALCAGAYFVSTSIVFDGGGPLEVTGERPLRWIQGRAVGPMPWAAPFAYDDWRGARVVSLQTIWSKAPLRAVYYGGCTWVELQSGDVLARYPCGAPAIVQQAVGRGYVVACGAHPEWPLDELPPEWRESDHSRALLWQLLDQHMEALCTHCMSALV